MEEAARNKATGHISKLEQGQRSGLVWLSTLSGHPFAPLDSQVA